MFNSQQNERLNELETQRAKAERELAERSAQDEALQTYLKQMDALLLEEDLASSPGGAVERTLARARTLSTLARLDGEHKKHVLLFLYEAGLIYKEDRVDFGIIS
jgi:hypothetical protein